MMPGCFRSTVLLFGCLASLKGTSVVNTDGRVFVLDLRNSSGLQGLRDAEGACASRQARLASAQELHHAVVECFFSPCTRGWLYGGTVGTTVCAVVGSTRKAVDVRTENTTEDAAHLDAFCIKDKGVPCGDPPSFPNVRLQGHSGYEMGDELQYTCVPGYAMPSGHRAFSLLCDSCGEWYGLVEICVKDETEGPVDYEERFSYGEAERHNEKAEEAHGQVLKEVHRAAHQEEGKSLEQQETSFSVRVEEKHPDQQGERGVRGEVIGRAFEGAAEEAEKEDWVAEDFVVLSRGKQETREVVETNAATEAPVSFLSQKHLFWFPSEAFQEQGHPVSGNPFSQTTQRAPAAQSEESKENDSQETHHDQRPADGDDHHDERDGHDDPDGQDDHDDSDHEEPDGHDDSDHNEPDGHDDSDHDEPDGHDDSDHDEPDDHDDSDHVEPDDHDDSDHDEPDDHDDSDHNEPDGHDDSDHDEPDGHDDSDHDEPDDHDDSDHVEPDDHDDSDHEEPDGHDDSDHVEPDGHDDSRHDDLDDHDSHLHKDDDHWKHQIPGQHDDLDDRDSHEDHHDHDHHDHHTDHYDMGEHEEGRDHVRSHEYADTYEEHDSYEERDNVTHSRGGDGREHPDGSEEHPEPDAREEHYDPDEDDNDRDTDHDDHPHDDHDSYHDHDSHEDDNDSRQRVISSIAADEHQNGTQKRAKGDTWLDGHPVAAGGKEIGDSATERLRPADAEMGTIVRGTDTPNEVEIRRPVHYTSPPQVAKSPTTMTASNQEGAEETWHGFTPDAAPSQSWDSPSSSDSLDYDTQQAAPTHFWQRDLTERPFLDHGPVPPMHDGHGLVTEGDTVHNLPGEAGERGEMEREAGEAICTGENCPPRPPSSSSRGPTMAAIIVALCAIATAVVVGVWCYRRQQQKSSMYEMNGKGQSQNRQGQHIEMQQKV
ncbi:uncharacterized protein susd5 [Spinachia spinachia]